ncbi:TonB-dependent receptor [Rhizorhabdus argentea]|uniref:TonB-dependent receptor n=1 Tax=Rhizorhabdus argentea TaxID=1387174 RepID=UPI0030EF7523
MISKKFSGSLLAGTALLTCMAVSVPARAVAQEPAAGEGDIVVTANKRAQILTDVGLSVAVVNAEALETRQISTTEDLATVVPGLSVGNSGFNTPIYSLRGVGVNELSVSSGSSVAIYVDEVPLTLPVMTRGAALDLERVEVLKGPQGTLYGQNATGGAINYIAAKPTDSFEAGVRGSYGRFNNTSLEGYVSGPLADTLKARVAGRVDRQFDGWQKSVSRPGDTIGEIKRFTGRAILQWDPVDTLRITLNGNGWIDKSDNQIPQLVQWVGANGNGTPASLEQVMGAPSLLPPLNQPDTRLRTIPNSPRWADWDQFRDFKTDDHFWQGSLRADLDLTEQITLTSISAFMKSKIDSEREQDGIGTSLFPATLGQDVNNSAYTLNSHTTTFSQEFRANAKVGALNWIVGLNYQHEKVADEQTLLAAQFRSLTALPGGGFTQATADMAQKIRGWSVFTNAEYEINDRFSVSGGIRYSEEDRKFRGCVRDTGDGRAATTFNTLYGIFGTAFQIQPGACYSAPAPRQPGLSRLELKENNIPWNVNLNFHPTNRSLIYARVSKGFKSGNFPTIFSQNAGSFLPVKQESVLAYEVGFKTNDSRWITAEGALFYYDYTNKQQRGRENTGNIFGLVAKQVNIPKSSLKGAEFAVTVRPAEGLTIRASEVFVKSKIKKYTGFSIDGNPPPFQNVPIDLSGGPLPFVPKHSVNIDVNYQTPITDALDVFVGGNMAYRSRTMAQIAANERWDIAPYTLFDAQLGIADRTDHWRVWLWGKNLSNELYWNNVIKSAETPVRYVGMARTYGLSASFKLR